MSAPDGYLIKGLIVLGDPPRSVAMGAFINAPDLWNASESTKVDWMQAMRRMLRNLGLINRVQIHMDVNHDYQGDLNKYAAATAAAKKTDAGTMLRDQIYLEFSEQLRRRELRRLHNRLYLCKQITDRPPETFSAQERIAWWDKILEEKKREFLNAIHSLNAQLNRIGASAVAMNDQDHRDHYQDFFNPSYADRSKAHSEKFNPMESIKRQTLRSGATTGHKNAPPFGFYLDGYYHNFIVLTRPPRELEAGMFKDISNLGLLDYRCVSTIIPVNPKKLVKERQLELNRTKETYVKSGDEASDTAIGLKKRIIKDITNGFMPYHWLCVLHVWDRDLASLTTKTQAVKDAIHEWDDADYYEPTLSSTCKKLWEMIHPGWAYGGYEAHSIYMNDLMMAKVMTMDSAFEGDLKDAWALYRNHNNGIVGIAPFKNGQPRHACLLGMSGAGKSELLKDLLRQCMPLLHYVVIIEEGFHHAELAAMFGTKSKVIHPNSRLCFNPFDTQGLPLSSTSLDATSTLFTRMFGSIQDAHEKIIIKAYISEYVVRLYNHLYKQKTAYDSALNYDLAKEAFITHLHETRIHERGDDDITFLDAWTMLRDMKESSQEFIEQLAAEATEEKVVRFMKDPATENFVRDIFFTRCASEQMPFLSMLVENMDFPFEHHDSKRLELIITVLRTWCRGIGSKGSLFDGFLSVPPVDKLSVWELSKLGDGENELKQMIGFQISNFERNKIMNMPRHLYKMFNIEEGAKYLGIPGSEAFTEELWAQMRKYRCQALFTSQQLSQLLRSSIADVVIGNSSLFYLLRQNDEKVVKSLFERVTDIPEPAMQAILNYDMPANNNFAASWFTYYAMDSIKPVCGTAKFQKVKEPLAKEPKNGHPQSAGVVA